MYKPCLHVVRSHPTPLQYTKGNISTGTWKSFTPALNVRYEFRFTSVISPSVSLTTRAGSSADTPYTPLPRRLKVKKSYLLLSWLYYLSANNTSTEDLKMPRIAILPARRKMYTLTKAPMAHKTNSKEQFLFTFYNYKFSISLPLSSKICPNSVQTGALSLRTAKTLMPVFETNLLFLKYYSFYYPIRDRKYFSVLAE
jgi:hypothetical protein